MTKCNKFKDLSGAAESWEEASVSGKEGELKMYWAPTPPVNLNFLFYFIVHVLQLNPQDEVPKDTALVSGRTWTRIKEH